MCSFVIIISLLRIVSYHTTNERNDMSKMGSNHKLYSNVSVSFTKKLSNKLKPKTKKKRKVNDIFLLWNAITLQCRHSSDANFLHRYNKYLFYEHKKTKPVFRLPCFIIYDLIVQRLNLEIHNWKAKCILKLLFIHLSWFEEDNWRTIRINTNCLSNLKLNHNLLLFNNNSFLHDMRCIFMMPK